MNLTNLHKAAGGTNGTRPSHWLELQSTQDFIEAVKESVGFSDIMKTTKGRYGGTFGHWQIALAYAKYLSPEFHIAANKIIKRYIEEEIDPSKDFGWSITLWHELLRLMQCQQ